MTKQQKQREDTDINTQRREDQQDTGEIKIKKAKQINRDQIRTSTQAKTRNSNTSYKQKQKTPKCSNPKHRIKHMKKHDCDIFCKFNLVNCV